MWSEDDPNNNAVVEDNRGAESEKNAAGQWEPKPNTRRHLSGRERSLSVPCRSEATNVENVVTKAKKASSYLWMLLHSQNCCVAADRCNHNGCADAKLVQLHLKTCPCPAGTDFPCPTRYAGCLQARKLLAHYRQCRNTRARQLGQSPSIKSQRACLICSMVARHARSLLDINTASPKTSLQNGSVVAHKRSTTSAKCQSVASFTMKAKINTGTLSSVVSTAKPVSQQKTILASFTLSADTSIVKPFPPREPGPVDDWDMPPPAPRKPGVSQSAPSSPLRVLTDGSTSRKELKSDGAPLLPAPLVRRRSGSVGSNHLSGSSSRAVTFAPHAEPVADVTLELEAAGLGTDGDDVVDDVLGQQRGRTRSASCHVLSVPSPTTTNVCGTIYEEIAHPSSYMDE